MRRSSIRYAAAVLTVMFALLAGAAAANAEGLAPRDADADPDPNPKASFDLSAYSASCGVKLVVTGNLPYQATGAVLRQVVKHREALVGAVLMVQREVRDRLVAEPGTKAQYGGTSKHRASRVIN